MSRQVPGMPKLALHQYACLRCRARRVKCDKILTGCANCAGHGAQCVYSARRPRKSQKNPHQESRVQRPLLPASHSPPNQERADSLGSDSAHGEAVEGLQDDRSDDEDQDALIPRELRDGSFEATSHSISWGKLYIGPNGKSQYISNDRARQVEDIATVLAGDEDSSGGLTSTETKGNPAVSSLLTPSSVTQNLRSYHPSPAVMNALWEYYAGHVDILVKILYKPDVEALIAHASRNPDDIDCSTEAFLFALWLAVVSSMSAEECEVLHGKERISLIRKYRYALEQALAQAGWMTTQELVLLQSLTLYLTFASENIRSTWIICGIAISVAQAMGIHTDGASSLGAIETEVRRRVWWTLCLIDVRVSENCGLEPHVPLAADTRLPFHINDSDLTCTRTSTQLSGNVSTTLSQSPSEGSSQVNPAHLDVYQIPTPPLDTEAIAPRNEFTEMTVSLVRIERTRTYLKFTRLQRGASREEQESVINKQLRRCEDVYLKYLNEHLELHRLCSLGIQLIMIRLRGLLHDASRPNNTEVLDEQLLDYNTEVLRVAHQLPDRNRPYGWFFRCKYQQWHAAAYILIQLCKHTRGPAVDRAWEVLDSRFVDLDPEPEPDSPLKYSRPHNTEYPNILSGQETAADAYGIQAKPRCRQNVLWQPLLRILKRARQARKQALTPPESLDTPPALKPGTEARHMTPTEQLPSEGLLSDPFCGQILDFGEEMSWEQLDTWALSLQNGSYQQGRVDYLTNDDIAPLNWW